jgi:twitching motility protein PilT
VFDAEAALRLLATTGGSDLHLKVPSPPLIRRDGALVAVDGAPPLTHDDTEAAVRALLSDEKKLAEWHETGEVDFAYGIDNLARFRVSAFRQRGAASLVVRVIPVEIRTMDELALPWAIKELAEEERGIVLVTGTTGSGKSTTLAAMIDHINSTMPKHVVTIEDPIEFLHDDKRSAINQREVGQDTTRSSRRCAGSCARTRT